MGAISPADVARPRDGSQQGAARFNAAGKNKTAVIPGRVEDANYDVQLHI
jgi:hypothetical protein